MVSNHLNIPNVIYWIIVVIGIVSFSLTENRTANHKISSKVMLVIACLISGGTGIYRTLLQADENIPLVYGLFVAEFLLLILALIIDLRQVGIFAIPYILGRYILGCLLMCAPLSLIAASKALGEFFASVVVIVLICLIFAGSRPPVSGDLATISINGENCMVLSQYLSFGGEVIEYRDSDGTRKTLSQEGPGSSLYRSEDGENFRSNGNGFFTEY